MSRRFFLLPLFFFMLLYLLPLGWRPLITPDEYRYGEIPREMIENGDYVVPTLLNARYFEKTPLGYWATAGAFKVFGENAFAIRLQAAFGALLAAAAIWYLIQQSTSDLKVAALGATLYLSAGLVYALGVFATLDSLTTGFLTACMVSFYLAYKEPVFNRRKIIFLLNCGIFAGLAFLTKGFLAFAVPGVTVVAFLLWEKKYRDFLTLPWLPLLSMLLVVLPWSILIDMRNMDFWRYFIEVEHIQRFLKDVPGQHPAPFWLLVPVIIGGIFPAGLLAPAAIMGFHRKTKELFSRSLYRFSCCYFVLPFLFFSASSGKLATYVLPCVAPLAVLGALGITHYLRQGGGQRAFHCALSIWGWLLTSAGLLALVVIPIVFHRLRLMESLPGMLLAVGAGTIWGVVLLWSRRFPARERLLLFFAGMVPLIAAGHLALPHEVLQEKAPGEALRAAALRFPGKEQIVVTHPSLMHAVAFEFKNGDILVQGTGEVQYGFSFEKGRALTRAGLAELLMRTPRPAVLFIARGYDQRDLPEVLPETEEDYIRQGIRFVRFRERH